MTPVSHIQTYVDPANGAVTFICIYCGASVGPIEKGTPIGHVEIFHSSECFHTEAQRLNAHMAMTRHDN